MAEVANARADYELARTEFERTKMLQERQLVSRSEFDQKQAQVEAARRQYEVARNGAEQQYQALMGAKRARRDGPQGASPTRVVRAPFDGVVGERLVSVGDYVTRGTKVASVMRVSPLRLELTVPAQYVTAVAVGSAVSLEVDAYPGETFVGQVRFVSPALRSDTRALDRRGGRRQRRRPAEAGPVRHRAHRAGGEDAGAPDSRDRRAEDGDRQPRVRRRRRSRRGAADHHRPDGRRAASKPTSGLAARRSRRGRAALERLKDGARVKAGS